MISKPATPSCPSGAATPPQSPSHSTRLVPSTANDGTSSGLEIAQGQGCRPSDGDTVTAKTQDRGQIIKNQDEWVALVAKVRECNRKMRESGREQANLYSIFIRSMRVEKDAIDRDFERRLKEQRRDFATQLED